MLQHARLQGRGAKPQAVVYMNNYPYVSRGGVKLAAALEGFELDVTGLICADLGSSTGGFVDCLLQHGAAKVYAVDTAYGQLAWKLRNDPRVVVCERSNALHLEPAEACDLVTIDLGWTKQAKAVPAALRWLRQTPQARIITLIKPHYESGEHRLDDQATEQVYRQILSELPTLGVHVLACLPSPIPGGKGGNREYLALLSRAD